MDELFIVVMRLNNEFGRKVLTMTQGDKPAVFRHFADAESYADTLKRNIPAGVFDIVPATVL